MKPRPIIFSAISIVYRMRKMSSIVSIMRFGELSVGSCMARLKLLAIITKRDIFSKRGF
jgi:hypothetical protein